MNLIDAIKSGRPFKRQSWGKRDWESPDSWSKAFLKQDILADDWEIQEPTVTITASQLITAVKAALADQMTGFIGARTHSQPDLSEIIARKLGLEP